MWPITRAACLVSFAALLLPDVVRAENPHDLIPDFVTVRNRLRVSFFDWGVVPGCVELRFTNGIVNLGEGPAEIVGLDEFDPEGKQLVNQRIYRSDGSSWERFAGYFVFHEEHRHVHFEDYAAYRLRAVAPGGGIGDIVFEGSKTSFCLLDSRLREPDLPGAPQEAQYRKCESTVQGISVGWEDKYVWRLPGQALLLCGIPAGTYWLESEADPDDHLLELDETNNAAAVQVEMPPPPACNNGLDDDGDGAIDFPDDLGCFSLVWADESPQCQDGVDNDGDGAIDYPDDPNCEYFHDRETAPACGLGAELALVLVPLALRASRRRGTAGR